MGRIRVDNNLQVQDKKLRKKTKDSGSVNSKDDIRNRLQKKNEFEALLKQKRREYKASSKPNAQQLAMEHKILSHDLTHNAVSYTGKSSPKYINSLFGRAA